MCAFISLNGWLGVLSLNIREKKMRHASCLWNCVCYRIMSGVCFLQMDKASIIKDAIDYIQHLHEQEKIIQAEIMNLESGMPNKSGSSYDFEQEQLPVVLRSKKKRTEQIYDSVISRNSPIEVLDVNPLLSLSLSLLHYWYYKNSVG